MSNKIWNVDSFLNLPVLKVSTNGRKINSVERRCLASSPRQVSILIIYPINQKNHNNYSSDRKCTLKLLAYFVFSAHFFSISFLKKGQYFHISSNLGFILEQIPLNSEKSKEWEDVILAFTY